MVLHTLNAAPDSQAFSQCIQLLQSGDALLLMGDGVYSAVANTQSSEVLDNSGANIYVLQPHAVAAGVSEMLSQNTVSADYALFVSLTEQYCKQQAWY